MKHSEARRHKVPAQGYTARKKWIGLDLTNVCEVISASQTLQKLQLQVAVPALREHMCLQVSLIQKSLLCLCQGPGVAAVWSRGKNMRAGIRRLGSDSGCLSHLPWGKAELNKYETRGALQALFNAILFILFHSIHPHGAEGETKV